MITAFFRHLLRPISRTSLYRRWRRAPRVRKLRKQTSAAPVLNVVIGAGGTTFAGWVSTDISVLDITSPHDWETLFRPDSIDRLLCEHVLEHLSESECKAALRDCYRYLRPGGLFRIAVPDGYRRDPAYVAEVAPPKDGHKSLFTVDTLVSLLESVGFRAVPLEYFDAEERFHSSAWDPADGYIDRSFRSDKRVRFKRGDMFYTSLIVDAHKV